LSTPQEYSETGSKKGRGMARRSLDLIEQMYAMAEAVRPITGRGVGYKLFIPRLIASMKTTDMQRVYRLLKQAREQGVIPWEWIVDETRPREGVSTWANPTEYARTVANSYRRDFWRDQPHRVVLVSEKGTVRGLLQPLIERYAVEFQPMGGFGSATKVHDFAQDDDGRPLHLLYAGDYDCSGMSMSEVDLPNRIAKYGGNQIQLRRIALTLDQVKGLPSFPASDKKKDPRYKWFVRNYGDCCWELDAIDPNDLRDCVEQAIVDLIEPKAWRRCELVNQAEQESIKTILKGWSAP
jgi:hypothetical protein